jgi:deferrochelatase/peroxidase EfeB
VQGLIFQSYNYPLTRHFLFQFRDEKGARGFLREWRSSVTHAGQDLAQKPEPLVNLAFSFQGLRRAGALDRPGAPPAERAFPWDFRDGPDAESMKDFGDSAPQHWWNRRFTSNDVDLLLLLNCQSAEALATNTARVRASAERHGLRELIGTRDGREALTGHLPDKGILHFGYRDGISQPRINWDEAPDRPDLVNLRHVLLGYWSQAVETFPRKPPWSDFVRDGSYLVMRWIYQDVARFNRFLRLKAAELFPHLPPNDGQELVAAKMMGRWRNGTPLVLSPDRPDDALALSNDFTYATDQDGSRCPLSAHIRIVNRRDDELTFANQMMFPPGTPRILRRGSSYGDPLVGEEDDGVDRGLIGMFLCANINMQFYPLMRWINKTDFNAGVTEIHGQDPLFGNRSMPERSDAFALGPGRAVMGGLTDFIRTQGVLTLLLPGLATLAQMADQG